MNLRALKLLLVTLAERVPQTRKIHSRHLGAQRQPCCACDCLSSQVRGDATPQGGIAKSRALCKERQMLCSPPGLSLQ